MSISPVIAVFDFPTFVGVVVMLISFLGWIINLINGAQGQPPAGNRPRQPPAPPRPPRDERLQNEIEIFLRENERKQAQQREAGGPEGTKRPARPRPPQPRREPPRPRPPQTPPRPPQPLPVPMDEFKTSPGPIGGDVRPALTTFVPGRVEQQVEQHLPHLVPHVSAGSLSTSSVSAPSPTGVAETTRATSEGQPPRAAKIAQMLRDPVGVRQAILLNEVLQRPKSLRVRS